MDQTRRDINNTDNILSKIIRENQVNNTDGNTLKFDRDSSLAIKIRDTQPMVTFNLRIEKKYRNFLIKYSSIRLY